jgi:hypothetical protein
VFSVVFLGGEGYKKEGKKEERKEGRIGEKKQAEQHSIRCLEIVILPRRSVHEFERSRLQGANGCNET